MARWAGYRRFCSLARGLDVVGERWTLLIIQELSFAPLRYNELRRLLPGIGSNILADRLRKLEHHNVIARVPAQVGHGVRYELTDRGRGLTPAIVELRKWGLDEQLMLDTPSDCAVHDLSYGLPAETDLAETYEWDIDGIVSTLEINGTTLTQYPGSAENPAVTIRTSRKWMSRLIAGKTNWTKGRESGEVIVEGNDEAWERMLLATVQPGANTDLLAALVTS